MLLAKLLMVSCVGLTAAARTQVGYFAQFLELSAVLAASAAIRDPLRTTDEV